MKLLLASLAILVTLAGCDRVAAGQAGHLIGQGLQQSYRLPRTPTVQVQGIPFLTQWASGRYREIDVHVDRLAIQGITVTDIAVRLEEVTTRPFVTSAREAAGATAATVSAEGLVPYAGLPLPPGLQLVPGPNGRLRLQGSLALGPATIPVAADLQVTIRDGAIELGLVDVQAVDPPLRARATLLLGSALSTVNGLQPAPLGLRLQSVQVRQDGLAVSAAGHQVPLTAA